MLCINSDMSTDPGKCIFLSVADVQPGAVSLVTSAVICIDSGRSFLPIKNLNLIGETKIFHKISVSCKNILFSSLSELILGKDKVGVISAGVNLTLPKLEVTLAALRLSSSKCQVLAEIL